MANDFHTLVETHGRNVGTREFMHSLAWPSYKLVYRIDSEDEDWPFPGAVAITTNTEHKLVLSVTDGFASIYRYNDNETALQEEVKHDTDPLFGLFDLVTTFLEMSEHETRPHP